MSGENFYLLTSLPALGELGSQPPLSLQDFLEHVAPAPQVRGLVEVLLLGDDLRQREALLAGEIDEVAPAVLTENQVRNEEPLPAPLATGEAEQPPAARLQTDAVWEAYYRHVRRLVTPGSFLALWVGHEVGLRNAFAAARAKALDLEVDRYLVAADLGAGADGFAAVVSEWSAAPTPLAGLQVVDAARWDWLTAHDGWFTFADDELTAYAAKLMLLHRWNRIAEARARQEGAAARG